MTLGNFVIRRRFQCIIAGPGHGQVQPIDPPAMQG